MTGAILRKAEKYAKKQGVIYLICIVLITLAASCCDDNNYPSCPNPETSEREYHFLYSFVGSFSAASVLIYSTKTGEIVDSAYYGRFPFYDAAISSDGNRVYYTTNEPSRATWVTEWDTGDTLAIVDGIGGTELALSANDDYVIISGAPSFSLLKVPEMTLVYESSRELSWNEAAFHPIRRRVYVTSGAIDSLLILDFDSSGVAARFEPLRTLIGQPITSLSISVSTDSKYLILSGGLLQGTSSFLQLRDPESIALIQEYSPGRSTAHLLPDGARVFFLEPWQSQGQVPGAVWELDLRTFLMTRILSSTDFIGPFPFYGLDVLDVDFTPDGKYALFIGGEQGFYYGPIIKYDLDTYRVVDAFYPSEGSARRILINPREIKDGG